MLLLYNYPFWCNSSQTTQERYKHTRLVTCDEIDLESSRFCTYWSKNTEGGQFGPEAGGPVESR